MSDRETSGGSEGATGMVAMRDKKRQRNRNDREQDDRGRDDDGERGGILSGALRHVKEGARAASEQLQRTLGDTTSAALDTVLDEAERLYAQQRKSAVSRVSGMSKIAART